MDTCPRSRSRANPAPAAIITTRLVAAIGIIVKRAVVVLIGAALVALVEGGFSEGQISDEQ